jgi:hypothetical protein
LAVTAQPALPQQASKGPSLMGVVPPASLTNTAALLNPLHVPAAPAAQLPHNKHATMVTEKQRWLQQLPASVRDQAATYLLKHSSLLNPRPASAGQATAGRRPPNVQQLATQAAMLAATTGSCNLKDLSQLMAATGAAGNKPGLTVLRPAKAASTINMPASTTGAHAPPLPQPRLRGADVQPRRGQPCDTLPQAAQEGASTNTGRNVQRTSHLPRTLAAGSCDRVAGDTLKQRSHAGGPTDRSRVARQSVPLTSEALKQLPVCQRPHTYQPVPSDQGSNAAWWHQQPDSPGSCASYPRTAVGGAHVPVHCYRVPLVMSRPVAHHPPALAQITDQESVTPSEMVVWNAKMQNLEATLLAEKRRRQE